MNRYRSWMNRMTPPPGFHARLMERLTAAGRTRRRPARALGTAAAAACLALAVVLLAARGGVLWPEQRPDPTAGVARTPEPAVPRQTPPPSQPPLAVLPSPDGSGEETGEPVPDAISAPGPTPAPTPQAAPTPAPDTVTDPFEGQPHGDFVLEGHDFPVSSGGWSPREEPKGCFEEPLKTEEILQILGGGDQVPWTLYWPGFTLCGRARYGGDGALWEVEIVGQDEEAENWFTLRLAPGEIPASKLPDVPAQSGGYGGDGPALTAWRLPGEDSRKNGGYTYYAAFMAGDVGVLFNSDSRDQESARMRAEYFIREYAHFGGKLSLDHLHCSRIPDWRDENLTLEQAKAEALGAYLPQTIPERYTFEMAQIWAKDGTKGEEMVVRWKNGEDLLMVVVQRLPDSVRRDRDAFLPEEVTPEALEKHALPATAIRGPDASYSFRVYRDGLYVDYYVGGLTYEEAAALVRP